MAIVKLMLLVALIAAGAVLAMRYLFPLPDIAGRAESHSLPADPETLLGAFAAEAKTRRPGKSAVLPLADGVEALAMRLALVDRAAQSVDAQYYIWHDDTSGILLFEALRAAARRGIRVRLLLDDNGVPGLDPVIAALNREPGLEVRLFNPSRLRRPKMLGYVVDFLRMNRRMHNKAMLVDGAAAIIGGRNIGDAYFRVGEGQFYVDLDVAVAGPIVPHTAAIFDAYWNCASAFAADTIIADAGDGGALDRRIAEVRGSAHARVFLDAARGALVRRLIEDEAEVEWTEVQVVADDPVKGEGRARRDQLMIVRLGGILGEVRSRLDLVSAYFIPGREGSRYFTDLAAEGRQVNILTNALDTTDVLLVHSGYTKYRRALLRPGVNLFELKLRGTATEKEDQLKPFGLSGASLHAKTFAVDGDRVFIGSFNFDPRSAMLNSEMGFLINSDTMAAQLHELFDRHLAQVSYQPQLTPEGRMVWIEEREGGRRIYQQEPGASLFQQASLTLIGRMPIEWML